MFNTNNLIKLGASIAGALLIFLFANWGADALYKVAADEAHGDEEHAVVRGFNIAPEGGDHGGEAEEEVVVAFADIYAAADPAKGEKVFGKCKACHKLEQGVNATGPSLYGIVGHAIAAQDFGYSDALAGHAGGTWTPEELNAWLTDPKAFAPGNKMTFKGLKKVEDRANLIAYLATIGG